MLGRFSMHIADHIVTAEIGCKAEELGIANLAVRFDQLATELVKLRTTRMVHNTTQVCYPIRK